MLNPFKEINWNPGPEDRRKFAKSLVIGFPCVAILFLLAGRVHSGLWVAGIGTGLGILLLCLPSIAKPFYLVWYFLASCIGFVVGNLLLAITFYVFVTGVGLLKRSFGKQPISKSVQKEAATYWRDAEPSGDPQSYYRQF